MVATVDSSRPSIAPAKWTADSFPGAEIFSAPTACVEADARRGRVTASHQT